jgi:hypothetical protein
MTHFPVIERDVFNIQESGVRRRPPRALPLR